MADGIALSTAVFGVGLGLIGFRRSSVLSLGLIGSTLALISSVWLTYRAAASPIVVPLPESWRFAESLSVSWQQGLFVSIHAAALLGSLTFERRMLSNDGFSRWRFVPAVAVNLCAMAPDAPMSTAAFFVVCCTTSAAPPAALATRPLAAYLGGVLVAVSTLVASKGEHVGLACMAMGFAMTLLAVIWRPERFYSSLAPVLAIAGIWLHLSATTFAHSMRSHVILAAACAVGVVANLLWSALARKPSSTHFDLDPLRPIRSLVQVEATLESGLRSASQSLLGAWRKNGETRRVSLAVFLMLAAAASIAALAASTRMTGVGP